MLFGDFVVDVTHRTFGDNVFCSYVPSLALVIVFLFDIWDTSLDFWLAIRLIQNEESETQNRMGLFLCAMTTLSTIFVVFKAFVFSRADPFMTFLSGVVFRFCVEDATSFVAYMTLDEVYEGSFLDKANIITSMITGNVMVIGHFLNILAMSAPDVDTGLNSCNFMINLSLVADLPVAGLTTMGGLLMLFEDKRATDAAIFFTYTLGLVTGLPLCMLMVKAAFQIVRVSPAP